MFTKYLVGRLVQAIPVLFVVSLIIFGLLVITPGDPVIARLGLDATDADIAVMRHQMGLDRPIYVRYAIWLNNALHGDLGYSWVTRLPVTALIKRKLGATLELALASIFVGLTISVPLGTIAAYKQYSWIDNIASIFVVFGMGIPSFWLGLLLILLISVALNLLPPSGYVLIWEDPPANFQHLIMPALTLGIGLAASLTRFLRSSLLDVLRQDYIRTARAKGLREKAIALRHVMKNALIPVVTIIGLQLGRLLGGAVVTEQVFAWPGVGWLLAKAIHQRDYEVVQGIVLFAAAAYVFMNLVVDVIYVYVDPRIRYSSSQ
jgi:peptide/nickel transport system permease protein